MRKLFKNLPLALLALTLAVGCGKENSSGSSKDPSSGGGSISTSNVNDVRSAFENKSMASGLSSGTELQHWRVSNGSSSQSDNCKTYDIWIFNPTLCFSSSSSSGSGSNLIIKVASTTQDSVSYSEATGYNGSGYIYGDVISSAFDRGTDIYADMLSIGNDPLTVVTTNATISFHGGGTKSATLVEYVYGYKDYVTGKPIYQNIRRFVLSTALPVIANPVIAFDSNGNASSRLLRIGNSQVSGVKANRYHRIETQQQNVNGYYQQVTVLKAVSGTISL